PPIETCWLLFAQRFARGPQHRMTQPDRTVHPALAGIWATIREKIHKGLQKRPLYRRTVPVVNTDDAAQSACLSLQVVRASHGEKEWRNRHPCPKKQHPHSTPVYARKRSSPATRMM